MHQKTLNKVNNQINNSDLSLEEKKKVVDFISFLDEFLVLQIISSHNENPNFFKKLIKVIDSVNKKEENLKEKIIEILG